MQLCPGVMSVEDASAKGEGQSVKTQ